MDTEKLKQLQENLALGKAPKGKLAGSYRLRVGEYRIIYDIIENTLLVWKIQYRRDIYR